MADLFDDLAAKAAQAYGGAIDLATAVSSPTIALPPNRILMEGKYAVRDSEDLRRIEALPRRSATVAPESKHWLEQVVEYMTASLRIDNPACQCAALGAVKKDGSPDCILRLLPVQAAYLYEAMLIGGILGPIGVGHGKTGIDILLPMVIPGCKVAVLLLPPRLVPQLKHDFKLWSQHFRTPNLAGCPPFRADGRPVLELLPYSMLSTKSGAGKLLELRPDVLMMDECHNAKKPKPGARPSARWARIEDFKRAYPACRHYRHSGTVTTKSVYDYQHHSEDCLGDRSILPRDPDAMAEWAAALDPVDDPAPIGALRRLCQIGENARQGFRRRLVETAGVVATEESAIGNSLFFTERKVSIPKVIGDLIAKTRLSNERPDGEPFADGLRKAACLRELSAGFYYVWYFPPIDGVPQRASVIDLWLERRKAYNKELYARLLAPQPGMDSMLLCWEAATRWHEGYVWIDVHGHRHTEPAYSTRGPYPVWASQHFVGWREVKDTVVKQTVPKWVDDFLVADALVWARAEPGIVWFDHRAFGLRMRELAPDLGFYGGGDKDDERMIEERAKVSIICSIDSHGEGKKLQKFYRSLMGNFPKNKTLEQVIGRTHRQGQHADEVEICWYRHTDEYCKFFDNAYEQARYVDETQAKSVGASQKLLLGSKDWR